MSGTDEKPKTEPAPYDGLSPAFKEFSDMFSKWSQDIERRYNVRRTPSQRLALYRHFAQLEMWKLRFEAVPLMFALEPTGNSMYHYAGTTPSGLARSQPDVWTLFETAGQAGALGITNLHEPSKKWMVRPAALLAYLQRKKLPFHPELEQAINEAGQTTSQNVAGSGLASTIAPHLLRATSAGYPLLPIEAALAAVSEFWLEYDPKTGANCPASKQIKDWLEKHYPQLKPGQRTDIDRLIRHPNARDGGNRGRKLRSKKS